MNAPWQMRELTGNKILETMAKSMVDNFILHSLMSNVLPSVGSACNLT